VQDQDNIPPSYEELWTLCVSQSKELDEMRSENSRLKQQVELLTSMLGNFNLGQQLNANGMNPCAQLMMPMQPAVEAPTNKQHGNANGNPFKMDYTQFLSREQALAPMRNLGVPMEIDNTAHEQLDSLDGTLNEDETGDSFWGNPTIPSFDDLPLPSMDDYYGGGLDVEMDDL